ncbi:MULTISPECIES: helix-turn-helix domain-containing protein [Amniculibacterium]|uniref:helix-turn-helix domain-containing protein n=1 Tax=Amniculibacterium TaxID=2715289 RepID=UPI001F155AD2|nr:MULTISPECIES: AraC family transcriptional regulator [Amniculibacterium]
MPKTLYIKNMVCNRCIMVIQQELDLMKIPYKSVKLGEVELEAEMDVKIEKAFSKKIESLGFEMINDKKGQIIERIKTEIIAWVHHDSMDLKTNLSDYLSDTLQQDYSYLSHLFSDIEGITIEKYSITQKIERVKELLVYDELSLKEIANLLNYSSTAYLSNQFKKITGLSPSHFKTIKINKRTPLDKV